MRRPTPARARSRAWIAAGLCCAATASMAQPQAAPASKPKPKASRPEPALPARWRESFEAFDAADRAAAPKPGGVLFVGSSSIRLWNDLEQQFEDPVAVVKRGFGGSRLQDTTDHLRRLVLPYKPRVVVVYAGDNDLAEGRSPQQVFKSFEDFVEGVHAELPATRIAFVSIKPSPLRLALMRSAEETNARIAAFCRNDPRLDYINVWSPMLGNDGRPREELFLPDRLHLNAQGYALWKSVIARHLIERAEPAAAAALETSGRPLTPPSATTPEPAPPDPDR
ncbi:MAG TPA: SGNH/GDSL hydrolase family protein [Methylibium sp.]|nr:SGNH/GDSL hydrolase family protein [Methylibium sp.]HEU4458986.1 SGNH/GDSL hydrolase family protein [Methylibium sp.]